MSGFILWGTHMSYLSNNIFAYKINRVTWFLKETLQQPRINTAAFFLLRFTPKHFFPPSKVALIYFDTLWHNAKCKLEVWFLYLVFLCSANDLWGSSAPRLMKITQKLIPGFALTLSSVLKLLLKSGSMLHKRQVWKKFLSHFS